MIFRGRPSEKHPVAIDIAWTLKPSSVWFRSWRFHELLCSVSMNQWLQYGPEVWTKPVKCAQKRSRNQLQNFWIGKEKPEHGMSCRLHGMDWIGQKSSGLNFNKSAQASFATKIGKISCSSAGKIQQQCVLHLLQQNTALLFRWDGMGYTVGTGVEADLSMERRIIECKNE